MTTIKKCIIRNHPQGVKSWACKIL
jgi:hypothetical protein